MLWAFKKFGNTFSESFFEMKKKSFNFFASLQFFKEVTKDVLRELEVKVLLRFGQGLNDKNIPCISYIIPSPRNFPRNSKNFHKTQFYPAAFPFLNIQEMPKVFKELHENWIPWKMLGKSLSSMHNRRNGSYLTHFDFMKKFLTTDDYVIRKQLKGISNNYQLIDYYLLDW